MNSTVLAIFRKEIKHILRDPQSLVMVVLMPLVMLFLYGYAITLDMKGIDTAILDEAPSPESRALAERLTSTDFFRIRVWNPALENLDQLFQRREARCALIIPRDYAEKLRSGAKAEVELVIDASDPNAASYILKYFGGIAADVGAAASLKGRGYFQIQPQILYNPDLRSANFFIPGLIAIIIILISTLLTSIAIAREKESGTMEQLLVSPVKAWEIVLGKVLPYTLLAFIDGFLVLIVGSLWFGVAIRGSLFLALGMMLIYIITGINLGILVSTVAKTQAVAMLAAVTLTVLPILLMSGFIFPVASMPRIFQAVSAIIPATYFLKIIRGIILKGSGLALLWPEALILLAMDAFLLVLSIRLFRSRLE